MHPDPSRREILAASAGLPLAAVAGACALPPNLGAAPSGTAARPQASGAVVVGSGNGLRAAAEAFRLVTVEAQRPVWAAVKGVAIVEDDPADQSVGLGGLPNEEGVVQLDAACMDGPTANAGAVGALEGIRNPAQVAYFVMEHTDHVLLVGEGAKRFAFSYGFQEEDLLTEESRRAWLRWRAGRSKDDDWLAPLEEKGLELDAAGRPYGTVHLSVLGPGGDLGCCTSTSGLAFKIPGRVGDSPLVGCGLYCDNEVGSAGATGRGEAAILCGGSWLVVERMRSGDEPAEACLAALRRVVDLTRRAARWQPGLWAGDRPAFNLTFYALRKDGRCASASLRGRSGERCFAVCDERGARLEPCTVLIPD